MAQVVAAAQPDLIEVNISCPNVGDEFGTPFSGSAESAAAGNECGAPGGRLSPIAVKLAPQRS